MGREKQGNVETVLPEQQQGQEEPIEQQTPIEKKISDRQKPNNGGIKSLIKPTNVDFGFSNDTLANEEDMSQVRDILTSGEEQSEAMMLDQGIYLTVEEVARFLQLAYDAQGFFTYKEMWVRDKSFFFEIAEGILPQIESWVQRIPAVGHAIKMGSAAGSWGRLCLDMGGTWVLVYKRRKLEKEKEEEGKQSNEPTNKPTGIFVP